MRGALALCVALLQCGALALVAGCATRPTLPAAPAVGSASWPDRRAALQSLAGFELRGRIAVSTGSDGFNARLRWIQAASRSDLALDGPLGVGGVRVSSDGRGFEVTTAKGEHLDRDAAQAEVQSRLGFEPPIAELRYWVLGVPAPMGSAQETVGPEGRLLTLEQDGWHIEYAEYRGVNAAEAAVAAGVSDAAADTRPTRVTLTRGPLRVRLIIDSWA